MKEEEKAKVDWLVTLVPFILIVALALMLLIFPSQSNNIIAQVRFFFGDSVGLYYLVMGEEHL